MRASNPLRDELQQLLRGADAKTLIRRYDVDFDIPMRRSLCLGLLEALGAFEADDPTVRVGAWWGRIVHDDVEYRLLHGLECVDDSRRAAQDLAKMLLHDPGDAETLFRAYVAARWHDGAGRIHFRCGDMMTARESFLEAEHIAAQHGVWFCLPDIQSNAKRASFDEAEKAGENKNLQQEENEFEALLKESEEAAIRHGVPVARLECKFREKISDAIASSHFRTSLVERDWGSLDLDGEAGRQKREFLRGLANVLHNLSIVLAPAEKRHWPGDLNRSLLLSERSAIIAFALGDGYRLSQALRHRASQILKHHAGTSKQRAFGERLLLIVKDELPWTRGKWMATQEIAKRRGKPDGPELLRKLFDELKQRQQQRGGDVGFDVDVHKYTVDALEEIMGRKTPEVRDLRREAARNIRRVVKVSTYRQRYAEVIFPGFLEEIEQRYDSIRAQGRHDHSLIEGWEDLIALIEEMSARELLDLLETNRGTMDAAAPEPGEVQSLPRGSRKIRPRGSRKIRLRGDSENQTAPRGRRKVTRTKRAEIVREEFKGGTGALYKALARARQHYEERALHRPVAAAAHDPDIAQTLRRLTADKPGLAIVRYFLEGYEAEGNRPRGLSAVVFRDGRMLPPERPVLEEGAYEKFESLTREPHFRGPSVDRAHSLWEMLIAPVWSSICSEERGLPEHLVLIPTTGMFGLPLHVALVPRPTGGEARKQWNDLALPEKGAPLGAVLPLSFSVSATAFATRRRHLLRRQPVDPEDDLCALVPGDRDIYPGELVGAKWRDRKHFYLAGERPAALGGADFRNCGKGDLAGLQRLLKHRAEFFVYAGHGCSVTTGGAVEVALKLADGDFLTQYDLGSALTFRRNKLAILGACVSGHGGDTASGEVAGFLRSFMAAGAGALCVTLWSVYNDVIAGVAGQLLSRAAECKRRAHGDSTDAVNIDIVKSLHEIQKNMVLNSAAALGVRDLSYGVTQDLAPLEKALHACPLVVYL